jgi:hypothetical protein
MFGSSCVITDPTCDRRVCETFPLRAKDPATICFGKHMACAQVVEHQQMLLRCNADGSGLDIATDSV